jgi:hypothetical protein
LIKLEQTGKVPALAALETRLGWPAVMTEGCRWIIGKGAWKWCGAPCVVTGSAGSAAWRAEHRRLVYMIGDIGVDPDQSIPRRTQIQGRP